MNDRDRIIDGDTTEPTSGQERATVTDGRERYAQRKTASPTTEGSTP